MSKIIVSAKTGETRTTPDPLEWIAEREEYAEKIKEDEEAKQILDAIIESHWMEVAKSELLTLTPLGAAAYIKDNVNDLQEVKTVMIDLLQAVTLLLDLECRRQNRD